MAIFAFVHLGGGQYDKALKVYKRLIGINPASVDTASTWRSALFRKVRLIRVRSAI